MCLLNVAHYGPIHFGIKANYHPRRVEKKAPPI